MTGFGFLFASDLFCLHPIFFVCSKPFFNCIDPCGPPYGTSSFSSDHYELISIPVVFTQIVTENELSTHLPISGAVWNFLLSLNLF